MSEWYYALGNQHRQGPVPEEALVGLFRSGRITLDTLVWREGQAQWQPLSDFADELDLAASEARTSRAPSATPPQLTDSYANNRVSPAAARPKQGLSGCMTAVIVCVIGGGILLAILGILAAIALPEYQGYVMRTKTTQALHQIEELKPMVVEFHLENTTCPTDGDPGFDSLEDYAYGNIGAVRVGDFGKRGHCGIEVTIEASDASMRRFDGRLLWLEYNPATGQWLCRSNIDDKYLPTTCRPDP